MGHWFYQVVIKLQSKKSYLMDFFLRERKADLPENSVRMVDIMTRWGDMIIEKGQLGTIIAFDSYYMCKDVRAYLEAHKH